MIKTKLLLKEFDLRKHHILLMVAAVFLLILNIWYLSGFSTKPTQQKLRFERQWFGKWQYKAKIDGILTASLGKSKKAIGIEVARGTSKLTFELPVEDSSISAHEDTITYQTKEKNFDVNYSLIENGLKEEIILHKMPSQNTLGSIVHLSELNAQIFPDGTYVFYDTLGSYQFHFQRPFVKDAKNNLSYNVKYHLIPHKGSEEASLSPDAPSIEDYLGLFKSIDGNRIVQSLLSASNAIKKSENYTLVLEIDDKWLRSKDRVWPITVDPTVVHDETSEFAGSLNRIVNASTTNSAPELTADANTFALYHMNNDWNDASGNAFNGTAFNGATFTANSKLGSHGGSFTGSSSQYVQVAHNASFHPTNFTLEFWIYPKSWAGTWKDIIQKGVGGGSFRQWVVREDDQNRIEFQYCNTVSCYQLFYNGTANIPLNQWSHIAFVVDQSQQLASVYLNGTFSNSVAPFSAGYANPSTNAMTIGGYSWDGYSNINLDEIRMSNVARTAAEIKSSALKTANFETYYQPLTLDVNTVALWHFDDTTGSLGSPVVYNYTGGMQQYTVPAETPLITVDIYGAEGGSSAEGAVGGKGGYTTAVISVTPGEILDLLVGGAGASTYSGGGGGYGGGGNSGAPGSGGGGGGGRSEILRSSTKLAIAGGGGGAGYTGSGAAGGDGGGTTGSNGTSSSPGGGGTQSAGGAGGGTGTAGAADNGGTTSSWGGGGGGGYYGGGGGGGFGIQGSGGGGSGYCNTSYTEACSSSTDTHTGNGQITITPGSSLIYFTDSSENGINAVATGATSTTSSLLDKAASFNGSSDFLTLSDSSNFPTGNSSRTIEAWIKPTSTTARGFIVSYGTNANDQKLDFEINGWIAETNGRLVVHTWNNALQTTDYVVTENLNKWMHVALVFNGNSLADGAQIYVNGKEKALQAVTGFGSTNVLNTTTGNAFIGKRSDNTGYFSGLIDEVRISNVARSSEEIKSSAGRRPYAVYTSDVIDLSQVSKWNSLNWTELGVHTGDGETPYSSSGLVASWNFNETSGTTASSGGSCGVACNGTLTNFASTGSQDAAAGTGWTASNKRWGAGALMFDGDDDKARLVSLPNDFKINTFTIEAWVKTTGNGGVVFNTGFTDFLGGSDVHNYALYCYKDYCSFGSGNGSTYNAGITSTTNNFKPNEWNHIVYIKNSTGQYFYINGKLDKTGNAETISYANYYCPSIGNQSYNSCSGNASYFKGIIDSLRVYSRTLSETEILSNYQAGNIQFQTRVGDTANPNDGSWEVWKPTTQNTQLDSFDSDNEISRDIFKRTVMNTGNNQTWTKYDNSGHGVSWAKINNTIPATSDTTSTDGRIGLGTSGKSDDAHAYEPAVLLDNGTYKMWYSAHDGTNVRISYATSPDGGTWTKLNNNIEAASDTTGTSGRLPLGTNGRGDDQNTYRPWVIKDGPTYKMWYSGHDGSNWRIFYATSPDGLTWTKYDNTIPAVSDGASTNGRIPLGNAGRGDSAQAFRPTVIKDGTSYKMWYEGSDGTNNRIYYATSPDGLAWTKATNTIPGASDTTNTQGRIGLGTAGKGDVVHAHGPSVIKDGDMYYMWYTGNDATNGRIYYATSPNGTVWTKYDNTIPTTSDTTSYAKIPLGTAGKGDVSHAYAPSVIKDGDAYRMFYMGYSGTTWLIYSAIAPAGGISNTISTYGQLDMGAEGSGDDSGVFEHTVIKDGSMYKMWYTGSDGTNQRIFHATSPDGLTWTKYNNAIETEFAGTSTGGRIDLGVGGTGDDTHLYGQSVLKDGSTYKMWYSGHDGTNWRIYYATSANGLTWIKHDNTIPANSDTTGTNGRIPLGTVGRGDESGTIAPHVIKDGSTYKMWYSGFTPTAYRIYYATSPDGLTWTKVDNTIPAASDRTSTNGRIPLGNNGTADDAYVYDPTVLKENNIYKMWYNMHDGTNVRIGYATSPDGLTWTKYDNAVLAASNTTGTNGRIGLGTADMGDDYHTYSPSVIKDGNVYKMWYSGNDNSRWRIFYATMTAEPITESKDTLIKQEGASSAKYRSGQTQADATTVGLWHFDDTSTSYTSGTPTTFSYTGDAQTYTVPANTSYVDTQVYGAQGGTAGLFPCGSGNGSIGGLGGYTNATIPVTPAEQLTVIVGGKGGNPSSCTGGVGGYNGGAAGGTASGGPTQGAAGGGGGGKSSLQRSGTDLVIAGGGGGAGASYLFYNFAYYGGNGGGLTGATGVGASTATGGTQSAGGISTEACPAYPGYAGNNGTLGTGGAGGPYGYSGGGGGGGYYGGAGGSGGNIFYCNGTGGGGGSGYCHPSATTSCITNVYNWSGNGQVTITPYYATINDSSSRANHAFLTGTSVVGGINGKARNFNGTSDLISVPDSNSLDITNNLTIEAWIYPTSGNTGDRQIAGKYQTNSLQRSYRLMLVDYVPVVFISHTGNSAACGGSSTNSTVSCARPSTALQQNAWSHIAGTFKDGQLRIYVNGVLASSVDAGAKRIFSGIAPFEIGGSQFFSQFYKGKIDEVRVSNSARTEEEIAEIYRRGRNYHISWTVSSADLSNSTTVPFYIASDRPGPFAAVAVGNSPYTNWEPDANTVGLWHLEDEGTPSTSAPSTNLLAYYPMDEASGTTTVADTSGNSRTGTSSTTTNVTNGKFSRARAFGGTDKITLGNLGMVDNLANVTVEAWVYPTAQTASTHYRVFSEEGVLYVGQYGNQASFYMGNGSWTHTTTAGGTIPLNQWSHVAWVKSGTSGSVYINGVATLTGLSSPASLGTSANVNYLSTYDGTQQPWVGYIDDVRIYNTARTQEQILQDAGEFLIVRDSSTFNNSSSRVYGTTRTEGKIGKGRRLNGVADFITIPDSSSLSPANKTLETWVKWNSFNGADLIAGKTNEEWLAYNSTALNCTANRIGFAVYDGDWVCASSSFQPTLGKWYYIVGTYDGANIRLYVNGALTAGPVAQGAPSDGNFPFEIGTAGTAISTYVTNAQIDEVRLSNTVRSADLIRQAYETGSRSHQVTIDFAAKLDSGNLITSITDTSFTVDATVYGLQNKAEKLFSGDKIIIRENDGTERIAQGTVTSVNQTTGAVTVDKWYSCEAGHTDNGDGTCTATLVAVYDAMVGNTDGGHTYDSSGNTIGSGSDANVGDYKSIIEWNISSIPKNATITDTILKYHGASNSNTDNIITSMKLLRPSMWSVSYYDTLTLYNHIDHEDNIYVGSWSPVVATQQQIDLSPLADADLKTQLTDGWFAVGINLSGSSRDSIIDTIYSTDYVSADPKPTLLVTYQPASFPAGGFSVNADVFKWQKEYFDIRSSLSTDRSAVTSLSLRPFNTDEGRTFWIDDLQYASDALTNPLGSVIDSSTGNQYFQYRAVLTTTDENVSPALTTVSLNYNLGKPNTPSLDLPTNSASNQTTLTPLLQFKTTATDPDSDYIRYKIELCTDLAMTQNCATFDQTSAPTGWSGQNTQTATAYTSGTQATYTIQANLNPDTTYYWRSYAIDPGGTNQWSATQGTPYSFTTTTSPDAPTIPYTDGVENNPAVADYTPEFSAIYSDGNSDNGVYYEVEVNTASDFNGTVKWDSTKTSMTSTASGVRSPDISYAGSSLVVGNTTYYWRIRFWDNKGAVSAWSATQEFTMANLPDSPTSMYTEGVINNQNVNDVTPEFSAVYIDPSGDNATDYEIEVNTASNFSGTVMWDTGLTALATTSGQRTADISYAGTALSQNGNTYYWRMRFRDENANVSPWSATQNFKMGQRPDMPTLDSPSNSATGQSWGLSMQTTSTDTNGDYLQYKIVLCRDSAMTDRCVTFDQTSNQTGWSGQNTEADTAYTSGSSAIYSVQSSAALESNTTYYWKSYAKDSGGTNTWSDTQVAPRSFTTEHTPAIPAVCFATKSTDNTTGTASWQDKSNNELGFLVQKSTNGATFSTIATKDPGVTSHAGDSIATGNNYVYRVRSFKTMDNITRSSPWCYTAELNVGTGNIRFENLRIDGEFRVF